MARNSRLLEELSSLLGKLPARKEEPAPKKSEPTAPSQEEDIVTLKEKVRRLAKTLGYTSVASAAEDLGVDFDGSVESWEELLQALEEAAQGDVEQSAQVS